MKLTPPALKILRKFQALKLWLVLLVISGQTFAVFPKSAEENSTGVASASQLESKAAETEIDFKPDQSYEPVKTGTSGLIRPGTAIFFPKGLAPESTPASLALVEKPQIVEPLPTDWALHPRFEKGEHHFRAILDLPKEVDLYGGGEGVGPLRRNGLVVKLWNTDNWRYRKDSGSRLYQSHPWLLGVRPDGSAFGVFFDSTWKAEMSCKEAISFDVEGPAFRVVVIEKASVEEVLKELGELTGKMELPPLWALGYQQCRWSYYPEGQVRSIAEQFRSHRIPCDVLWVDIDYMDGFRVFSFENKGFPDPKKLNEDLHQKGFKAIWMIDPGVKVDPNYPVYQSGKAAHAFVCDSKGAEYHGEVWPGACAFPDFTNPAARKWWSGLYAPFIAKGIDGVWNDMNEPAVFKGPDGTMPEGNLHRGGGDLAPGIHRQYHNVYGMLMSAATREGILSARPERRPFVLTRASFLGGQRYAATWTGDNASDETDMKRSVPMSLNLGLSGQPFNGPDLGGFAENASPQLWSQWVGFGTFFPFVRAHASKFNNRKEPWEFGPEVEKSARIAIERRYRLLPYLYTLFQESSATNLPVMRPLFMADPTDRNLRDEQGAFLLGRDLMVVPRWCSNPALPRQIYPEISLVSGDREDNCQATVRIRPGAIVPLGRVIENTTEKSLDPLTLLVCLDSKGQAEGRLYEDAGEGFGYRKGEYRSTTFQARAKGDRAKVWVVKREGKWPEVKRMVEVRLIHSDGREESWNQEL